MVNKNFQREKGNFKPSLHGENDPALHLGLKGKQQERALKDKIASPVIISLHLI